ncbi:MAG: DMT family transporter [Alphaproteobacteria bacterium]|nr:DMT family transporter [Alphaproteobacteria bacterium]
MPIVQTSAMAADSRSGLGIACAVAGFFGISVMDACAKLLGEGYAISQVILARNGVGALVVLVFVLASGSGLGSLRTHRIGLLVLRTAFSLAAGFLFFTGLRYLPLADAFAIAFTAPLFITALSMPLLGEHVGVRRGAAAVLGFVGVLVVIQPGTTGFRLEALLPLGAALSYALTMLVSRRMTRDMTTSAIMFWSSLGAALAALTLMPSQWQTPGLADLGLFLFMGLVGTLGMSLITQGYRFAQAAVIAPFDYSALLWAIILGWLIWDDVPGPHVWFGSFILISSGLYILHRETRKRSARQPSVPPQSPPPTSSPP